MGNGDARMLFYAHSREDFGEDKWQTLSEHLEQVANLARIFASDFGAGDWGYAAGYRHDFGKATLEYLSRLRGNPQRVDHSTAGAQQVSRELKLGTLLAACIAGHHGGLPDGLSEEDSCLAARLRKSVPEIADSSFLSPLPVSPKLLPPFKLDEKRAGLQLAFFTRMIFSCLVDADFLDTEKFLDPEKASRRSVFPEISDLSVKFFEGLGRKFKNTDPTLINSHRGEILRACLRMAEEPAGLFSLTVPTGGGKTISSLAFALEHALRKGLKRIIYVIPFTSIIEQNADVFRSFLGDDAVVEHHSAFDAGKRYGGGSEGQEFARRFELASENWDAPIVVTTGVQFFESIFAAKPSRCRKLHNLARSVIILDEAQMLPTRFLVPCVRAIEELAANYGSSIVLCTATQPSLRKTEGFRLGIEAPIREIVENPRALYEVFRRVRVENGGELDLPGLASLLVESAEALCIVNTRREAWELFKEVAEREGVFHLSALMCAEHRAQKLDEIKDRLRDGSVCRLVSTRLIEAGVDIDFPVVLRAVAGIDSIAQAAGRCNREGKLKSGRFIIFKMAGGNLPHDFRPPAETAAEIMLKHVDPLCLDAIDDYFRMLYWKYGDLLDEKQIISRFQESWREFFFPFRSVADDFEIIRESGESLLIPFDEKARKLIRELQYSEFPGTILRKLQRYVVQAPYGALSRLKREGAVSMTAGEVYPALTDHGLERFYDREIGLNVWEECPIEAESMII